MIPYHFGPELREGGLKLRGRGITPPEYATVYMYVHSYVCIYIVYTIQVDRKIVGIYICIDRWIEIIDVVFHKRLDKQKNARWRRCKMKKVQGEKE